MMLLNFTEERQSKDGTLEKRIGNIFLQNFDNNGPWIKFLGMNQNFKEIVELFSMVTKETIALFLNFLTLDKNLIQGTLSN